LRKDALPLKYPEVLPAFETGSRILPGIHIVAAEEANIIPHTSRNVNPVKSFFEHDKWPGIEFVVIGDDKFCSFIRIELVHPIDAEDSLPAFPFWQGIFQVVSE